MDKEAVKKRILIVDDEPINLSILKDILCFEYDVILAENGLQALEIAQQQPYPDLILLDVMMPGMNGYAVCKKLKDNEDTSSIPIIFVTTKGTAEEESQGLELGGQDYIVKPIHFSTLLSRINTHLQLRQQQQELEHANIQLEEMQKLRQDLVHMLIHDLRSPLAALTYTLELIPLLDCGLNNQGTELVERCHNASTVLIDMVSAILDVNKLEDKALNLKLTEQDIAETLQLSLKSLTSFAEPVVCKYGDLSVKVLADHELIRRVVVNLLSNGLRFSPSYVGLDFQIDGDFVVISVDDKGPGIPESEHENIFQKFGQLETGVSKQYTSGLGLCFCKMAVEAHGGRIGVNSRLGEGSVFWLRIPRNKSVDHFS